MSILSHFLLNTDYTAPKETHSFDQTLSVAATSLSMGGGTTKTFNITVPDGIYFENTTLDFNMSGVVHETAPTPFLVFAKEIGEYQAYQIVMGLRKTSNSQYQIFATIQNMSANTITVPAFTVNVKCHLFVSSF